MKWVNKGLSLIEIMVALGLLGAVFLVGFNSVMDYNTQAIKKSEAFGRISMAHIEIKEKITRFQKNVSWSFFDSESSYGPSSLVSWKFAAVSEFFKSKDDMAIKIDGQAFFQNSHTLEIPSASGSKESTLLVSRCVPKDTALNSLDIPSIQSLKLIPFIRNWQKTFEVHCCPIGSEGSCQELVDFNGRYRVGTFHIGEKRVLKTYPANSDLRFIDSTGFFLRFNKNKGPTFYSMRLFSLGNLCSSKSRKENKCSGRFVFRELKTSGSVKMRGVKDSGFIEF